MKKLIILLFPALLWAQDFEFFQQWDGIPLEVDSFEVTMPWMGGFSNTRPAFCDIDDDSDYELILGQYSGKLTYFVNWGTPSTPLHYPEELSWFNIDAGTDSGPTFCDIDADGDQDLFVSNSTGKTLIYYNTGSASEPEFSTPPDTLRKDDGAVIIGTYGDFADVDGDGDFDFITGTHNDSGILFYENTGTAENYLFTENTTNFGNVIASASSKVELCDIDNDGDADLFLGLYFGKVKFYRNIGTIDAPQFFLEDENWLGIDVGEDATPVFCDLDNDGDFDLFLGLEHGALSDPKGALHYWENIGSPENPDFVCVSQMYLTFDVGNRLDHKIIDFDNDGDGDIFFYYYHLGYLENTGTPSEPYFVWRSWNLGGPPSDEATFDLGDLDNDGDVEMIFDWPGDDYEIWDNVGTPAEPQFEYLTTFETAGSWSQYPALVDIDADLDLDFITSVYNFSHSVYELWFYRNDGSPEQFDFTFITDDFCGIYGDSLRDAQFKDLDFDEDFDMLMYNSLSGRIIQFRNDGTIQNPVMTPINGDVLGIAGTSDWRPEFYDLDDDYDLDVTIATQDGGILFFRNITGDTTAVTPRHQFDLPDDLKLYAAPNPANPSTTISFDLPSSQKIVLSAYNTLGQQVALIADGLHLAGHHQYNWSPSITTSGIYFIHLQAGNQNRTTKLVIIK